MIIPVKSSFLLDILTEIGRARALSDTETDLVEEIIRGETGTDEFHWTKEHDAMLVQAARRRSIHRLARDLGVSDGAAYARLHRVRKRKPVKLIPDGLRG